MLIRSRPRAAVTALGLLVLLAVAAGLRWPHFATRPFWYDEVHQLYIAEAPNLAELADRARANDRNPPLGHLLTRLGYRVSETEGGARLPSLLTGLATVLAAWWAGRVWVGRVGAWWLAAFVVVSPVFVFYSRECRPYAPGVFAVFVFLAAAGVYRLRPTVWASAGLAASAAAAVSFQYAGAVVVAIGLLALAAVRPRRPGFWSGWIAAGCVAAGLAAWWAVAFARPQVKIRGTGQTDDLFAGYFFNAESRESAAAFFGEQVPAFFAFPLLGGPIGPRWTLLSVAAFTPCLFALLTARRPGRRRFVAGFALASVAGFIALAGAGKHPFGGIRHCLPLVPGLFLLLAAGVQVVASQSRVVGTLAGGLVLAIMAYGNLHAIPQKHLHHGRSVLDRLQGQFEPGDRAVVAGPGAVTVIGQHYLREYRWLSPVVVCRVPENQSPPPAASHGPDPDRAVADALAVSPRVWVIELSDEMVPPPPTAFSGAGVADAITGTRARATLYVRSP